MTGSRTFGGTRKNLFLNSSLFRNNMNQFNKRDYRRRYIGKVFEYVMVSATADEPHDGIIFDISETGMSILTTAHLMKDQKIFIKGDISVPSRSATVIWSKQYYNLYYKVGLQFIESRSDS